MALIVQQDPDITFSLNASYIEIYNEEIIDLLADTSANDLPSNNMHNNSKKNARGLDLREDEHGDAVICGLTSKAITNMKDILEVLTKGRDNRTVDSHILNDASSRSHALLQVTYLLMCLSFCDGFLCVLTGLHCSVTFTHASLSCPSFLALLSCHFFLVGDHRARTIHN